MPTIVNRPFTLAVGNVTKAECAHPRCTLHGSSTIASVRFLRAAANPVRGGLSIDRPPPYQPNPFCFSAARRLSCVHDSSLGLRRAAEKQKVEYYSRIFSINRSPLTGLAHSKAAHGGIERRPFLSGLLIPPEMRARCSISGRSDVKMRTNHKERVCDRTALPRCARVRAHSDLMFSPTLEGITPQRRTLFLHLPQP
jgi:hypothetical protein